MRKLLGYMSTLKWLKYFLEERTIPRDRLVKLREDLQRRSTSDNRNYEMMRQMLLKDLT